MRFFEDIRVNLIYWWNKYGENIVEGLCELLLPVFFILCIPIFIVVDIEETDREWCKEHGYSEELSHKEVNALKRELKRQEKDRIRQRLSKRNRTN